MLFRFIDVSCFQLASVGQSFMIYVITKVNDHHYFLINYIYSCYMYFKGKNKAESVNVFMMFGAEMSKLLNRFRICQTQKKNNEENSDG